MGLCYVGHSGAADTPRGDWHHRVDREAKYHLQKFPRLPKMCLHHTVNRQYFIPLLKYLQTH